VGLAAAAEGDVARTRLRKDRQWVCNGKRQGDGRGGAFREGVKEGGK